MPLTVVYSPDHVRHVPDGEIWVGVRIAGTELPSRGEAIYAALVAAGHEVVGPHAIEDDDLFSVHDPALVRFLQTAYADWQMSDYPQDPGQDRVVPYAFPHPDMLVGSRPPNPASVGARTGLFAMDTMTLIGPGTWEAVRAAASCALTAADLILEGKERAYAAVRPPGHHSGRSFYGGSCYLNNAALAAQRLTDGARERVAVIDIDAHHGNGTQQIFYETDQVIYGSVHIDPGAGYFPHWVGFSNETGRGKGEGANKNVPLAPGTGDAGWLAGIEALAEHSASASALVVSLGVDSFRDDPESPLAVSVEGHRRAGGLVKDLGKPTVVVQEGGYNLDHLGELVVSFLDGLENG
ncbi:MAG TPA: histone deacetylase family protein [Acidimicrobiia bacterium]|nr:histone deacetylase family protein [Acidimicrobiia bacterium]